MPRRSRARFNPPKSSPTKLVFDGGKFANLKVQFFEVLFVNDRFWAVAVVMQEMSKGREKEYATFHTLLTEKYGPPTSENRTADNNASADWWIPTGNTKNHISIWNDLAGKGLKVFYASDAVKNQAPAAPLPVPASKAKPLPVSPGAKRDL